MNCSLKAWNQTAMRIEIFEGFCIMFVKAKFIKIEALTQVFLCRFSEIFKNIFFIEHIWATAYVHSNVNSMLKRGGNGRLASTWCVCRNCCFTYIPSSLTSSSALSISKSLNFDYLSFKLHDVQIFRWESDTFASLYSAQTCFKFKWPALEMHICCFRTSIFSWNFSV